MKAYVLCNRHLYFMAALLRRTLVHYITIRTIQLIKFSNYIEIFDFKSRITNVEITVVQKLSRAVDRKGLYIFPVLIFLLLFVSRQKVNNNLKK